MEEIDTNTRIKDTTNNYIEKTINIYNHFKVEETTFLKEYQHDLQPKDFFGKLFFVFSNSEESLEFHVISKILEERASESVKKNY